jgi:hypothetical protein
VQHLTIYAFSERLINGIRYATAVLRNITVLYDVDTVLCDVVTVLYVAIIVLCFAVTVKIAAVTAG